MREAGGGRGRGLLEDRLQKEELLSGTALSHIPSRITGMMLTELLLGMAIEEEINELRISGSRRP